ncbi:MAG: hypothetical protein ACE5JU_21145 [Candidatus Binatia bacterium]
MSQPVFETNCFLCGSKARHQAVDDENHHFACDGPPPAEYRISNHAMKTLEQMPKRKAYFSTMAHQQRSYDEIYVIHVDFETQQVTGDAMKRPSWR